jgi:hypothetical protein
MKYIPAAALALSLFLPHAIHAQPTRDFSGSWTMDLARSESAHQGEPFKDVRFVIAQGAAQVRIETTRGNEREDVLYPLGRARSSGGPVASTASGHPEAYWEGDKLVTETQRLVSGYTVTVKEARTLGSDGKDMTVETTVIVQHGYSMRGVKNYGASTDVFVRATP